MHIFIRYAAISSYFINSYITKAYDSRILYILEGDGEIYINGKTYPLVPNTFCYYPAGTSYKPSAEKTLKFITINFDFTDNFSHITEVFAPVEENSLDKTKLLSTHLDIDEDEFLSPIHIREVAFLKEDLIKTVKAFQSDNKYSSKNASALLQHLLYKLLDYTPKKSENKYNRILSYINENLYGEISNESIAKAFNYHPNYVNALFKKNGNTTIRQYILSQRLSAAAKLLSETDFSISEISKKTGFCDANYFTASFSKKYGITPTKYRRTVSII